MTNSHPNACPAPENEHTHATVVRVCAGRFGTCNKRITVNVWRYVIGRDRLRQMGDARCPDCFHTVLVTGDVPTREQALTELSELAAA